MNTLDTLIQQKRPEIEKIIRLHFNPKHSGATNDSLDEIESTIREVASMVCEKHSDIELAILALYKIVGMNHITPDIVSTANFMLQDYEKERGAKYVRHLLEQINELRTELATAKEKGFIQ